MSTVVGAMEAYLKLNIDDFESNLAAAKKQVESISAGFDVLTAVGDKISGVGKSLTLGLTTPIVGLGAACVKATSDFDSIMSKVSAISGVTGDSLQQLRDKAKEMGAVTKFSAVESGEAFTYMAMAGWDAQQMMDGIAGIMDLAAADGLDLATTSDIVTDALTAFGLQAKDSGHFADVLAKASSSANTNVSMLGESFKYVAPVAGSMGYSVEDVAVALGLMANSGIKAGQAGTAMRAALSRMVKPTDKAAELMKKYDLSLTNSDGSMKSLSEVMIMLRQNMGDLTEAEQLQAATTIFGQEAMSGMLAIINSSDEDFNKLSEAIGNADGTAKKMADTLMDNLGGEVEELMGALETLAISFGELIIPIVRDVVAGLQKFVDKLNELDEGQKKTILTIAAVVAAIGPVLLILGKTISTIGQVGSAISSIKALCTALGPKLATLGAQIGAMAGPVLAVVAVIAVLVAAFKHLWETNEEFRNTITAIWNEIVGKFNEFCQGIVERLNALGFDFENIGEVLKAIWDGFCNFLAPVFEAGFGQVLNIFSYIVNYILSVFDIFVGIFTGDWTRVWEGVKGIFTGAWEFIKNTFTNWIHVFEGQTSAVLGWFNTNWQQIWTSIRDFFVNIWNGIKDFFVGIWTAIKNVFTNAMNAIKTFVTNAVNAIKNTVTTVFNNMKNGVSTAINNVKNAIVNGFNNAVAFIKNLPKQALTWGKDMINGFVNGVKQAMTNLINTVKNMANKVRSYLHFSRPDVGPLHDYETWMPDMIDGLSKTLASASPTLIDKVRALSGNMSDALNGGNYQLALAGAGADIRAGGTGMLSNNYTAFNKAPEHQIVEKTEIHIDKIEVRDDHDLDVVTQGLYNKQDQNLRALGRRNV